MSAIIALVIAVGSTPTVSGGKGSRYLYVTTYIFENRGDEAYELSEDDATIPLFHSYSWQTVRVHNATHPMVREHLDDDGNRLTVLDLPTMVPPDSSLRFSVTYEVESYDQPKPDIDPAEGEPSSSIPSRLVEEFCVETETFTAEDEEIQALARRLTANETSVLGRVNRLLGWLIENVSYTYWEVPCYPRETLAQGRGDCDDQAILLVTLCRALDIPAILQVGVIFHEGIESERTSWGGHLYVEQRGVGWHGWALVYIPPWGWLPVDMTMVTSRNPLSRIMEAPEYEHHIVTCFNVSRLEYVGNSRRSQARLMSSDIYVSISDKMVSNVVIEESSPARGTETMYLILGLSAGSAALVAIFFLGRRRMRRVEEGIL